MKRYKFIDISKGIGITLVVLYHAPSIGEISHIGTFYWGGGGYQHFTCLCSFCLVEFFTIPTKLAKESKTYYIHTYHLCSLHLLLKLQKDVLLMKM